MLQKTRGNKGRWAVLAFVLCLNSCFTQTRLSFEHYRIADGLSQSTVTCIVEDAQHQLWFGTQEGINRFDGISFESFTRQNTSALNNTYIYSSTKDTRNDLWFGTRNGLIKYSFRQGKFASFLFAAQHPKAIQQLQNLSPNKLLLRTSKKELFVFNTVSERLLPIQMSTPIRSIVQGDGVIFALGTNNTIYKITKEAKVIPWFSGNATIHSVHVSNKTLFVFTEKEVFTLNPLSSLPKRIPLSWKLNGINPAYITSLGYQSGIYYLTTAQQGLVTIDTRGKTTQHVADLFQTNKLNSNNLNTLFLSDEKVLWLGSDRGISCAHLSKAGYKTVGVSTASNRGLPCENVWSFASQGKEVFVGTDLGITRFNLETETTKNFLRDPSLKTDVAVMDMVPISKDNYLLACFDGVFEFNPAHAKAFRSIPIKDPRLATKHAHFFEVFNIQNTYLIGTSAGLLQYDFATKEFKEIHVPFQDQVRKITTDAGGKLWVLFETKGLYYGAFTAKGLVLKPFKYNKKLRELSKDPFSTFTVLKREVFLLGTMGGGLVQISREDGTFESISKAQGLPNNTINSLISDAQGNVWGSTNRGLICIKPSGELNARIERRGIQPNEYNMNAAFLDNQGNVFFGGIFGFVYFNPKDVVTANYSLYPIITKITFQKKSRRHPDGFLQETDLVASAHEIVLPYNARDFEVRFQPNLLFGAKHVSYKYVLIGEETDTIYIGNTNKLAFNSLASGTYYLRLYARYENGPWTDTPALLTVTINAPFWATIPFWLGVALLLIVLTILYVRFQVSRERKQRILLESLVSLRTQEIEEKKAQIERKNTLIIQEKEKVLEQQKLLFIEKERAEKWLNNALPSQAVAELKVHGKVPAKAFDSVTILFTDVVGFSKISDSITPSRLVNRLDVLFRKFDEIIKANNLEKIKTIGDAYMAVGGLPEENSTHAIDTCITGLQIQHYMQSKKFDAIANHKEYWEIRLGINSGPVTAGIIGTLKMAYDVWGSAVNQAQRMEMLGEAGAVTISEQTFKLVEPYFECIHRGKAQMKSNVILDMYEVLRIKPELSLNGEGLKPNDLFYEIVGLHHYSSIKYYTAENELIQLLAQELPPDLSYHSLAHTKDVVKAVERIALLEGVRDEGLFLLKSAALFHDAGFVKQYEHNEPIGAAMAETMLPKYGYNEQHIKTIKELIYVTQIPHRPVNKLQEIMCDADLDYLGTDSFEETGNKLKIELMAKGKIHSDREWDQLQITFLKQHKYFTQTAILTREKKKKEHLKEIKQRFEANNYD
jgi:class 3 adenylate cyclase/ligand-binding sensor domain-containing protein/predicted metal-dependent HD superfamily phosphohydrolase